MNNLFINCWCILMGLFIIIMFGFLVNFLIKVDYNLFCLVNCCIFI